jgi:hypothetical protein
MNTTWKTLSIACVAAILPVSAFAVDINGGTSWSGWNPVGNSLSLGIYAGGNVNRDFDIYVTQFTFNNDTVSGSPIQAGPGHAGFSNGSGPLGFGNYAAGSFANGNTIFGLGMKMRNGSRAAGNQFVNFDLDGAQFTASTVVNESLANGVWDAFGTGGQVGDFSIWMDGVNNGPSNLGVKNGAGGVSNLAGGSGSGTGYNYAFRHFRQGDVNGSIQMFFDLTGMQALYGVGGSLTGAVALPGQAGGWNPSVQPIGAFGSNFKIGLYSAAPGGADANQVTFGAVPEPGTMAALGLGVLAMARRKRK